MRIYLLSLFFLLSLSFLSAAVPDHKSITDDNGVVSSNAGGPLNNLGDGHLPVQFARKVGTRQLGHSLPKSDVIPQASSESQAVISNRLRKAATDLQSLADGETKEKGRRKAADLKNRNHDAAVRKARLDLNKRRSTHSKRRKHSYYSRDAVTTKDRNFNSLFPAHTKKSDRRAPANQQQDFHHKGAGDVLSSESKSALGSNGPTALDPCAEKCDRPQGWTFPGCQDCILRGMVNGWILRSIQDAQKGYNYAHWSRNQCVKYAKSYGSGSNGHAAPFADCWFQQMHETCNL